MRTTVIAGVAKKVFDEARKPENQRRLQQAVRSVQERRAGAARRRGR